MLCKYIKRKIKYNKGLTRTDVFLVSCHSTMLTAVGFLQHSFISGRKLDTGYGTFCPSIQKTGYVGSLASRFLAYHHEQEIVQIFTHMKLINLT